ncbi:electron transfer flavoprotein subunit alpha/FixB family protein [Gemmatimonadota bacterium]
MPKGVLVIAETRDGELRGVTAEAISAGRWLADGKGEECSVLLAGSGITDHAGRLGAYGADTVYLADHEALGAYSGELWLEAVAVAITAADPAIILIAATSTGKDLAPRIAARFSAGYAASCTGLSLEGGTVEATRPVYAGKIVEKVRLTTEVGVISMRPKSFEVDDSRGTSPAIEQIDTAWAAEAKSVSAGPVEAAAGARVDLTEADRIVSGGRGMGGPENWGLLEEVAGLLGAELGASRAAVDAGWRPHSEQVGQTGKVVTPGLYIACGISGAMQHLAGMGRSKVIVAINRDKDAPIFQVADYGVVGNVMEVLPALAGELRNLEA